MPVHLEIMEMHSRAGMELRQDFNKALHFTNEEIDHITSSILYNFLVSYLGDLIGKKRKRKRNGSQDLR